MKVEFCVEKCWGEAVEPASMDTIRMAILEILTIQAGEGHFYLFPNNRDAILRADNDLMMYFSDEEGTPKISAALVHSVTEMELVCGLFLNQEYEKVFDFLEARQGGEFQHTMQ